MSGKAPEQAERWSLTARLPCCQALVTRMSARLVMAAGMTLTGAGILWATQVPVHRESQDHISVYGVTAAPGG